MFSFHTPSTVAKRLAHHFTCGRSRVLNPVLPDQVWVRILIAVPWMHLSAKNCMGADPGTAQVSAAPCKRDDLRRLQE
ncbi:hypothetical protein GEV33_003701 [Tenebrio molitor]|uniref:Uncharacterized protein n=1 Tax=Tenebrio molitor TaxID=7067 RepID=A0A8J6HQV2_TENMO|nr:hypothetical protein GEV33_003701 [Tenebrio molitor]